MVVMLIGLLIGLVVFFIGISLITVYRKENADAPVIEDDGERRELKEEELAKGNAQQSNTYDLGILLGGEGLALAVISAAALLIHGLITKIPLYVSIPVLCVYLGGCFVLNALKMYKES